MLGTHGSLIVQAEVYPHCVIVEVSRTRIKYIVAMCFVTEVINCAIVLVFIVALQKLSTISFR